MEQVLEQASYRFGACEHDGLSRMDGCRGARGEPQNRQQGDERAGEKVRKRRYKGDLRIRGRRDGKRRDLGRDAQCEQVYDGALEIPELPGKSIGDASWQAAMMEQHFEHVAHIGVDDADTHHRGDRELIGELPRNERICERHRYPRSAEGGKRVSAPLREHRRRMDRRHDPCADRRRRSAAEDHEQTGEDHDGCGARAEAGLRRIEGGRDGHGDKREMRSGNGNEVRHPASPEISIDVQGLEAAPIAQRTGSHERPRRAK